MTERVFVTRDVILAAQDIPTEDVEVPEWGGWVRVRGMTGVQRDAWETELNAGKGKINWTNARARLLARCLVDEKGKRLFRNEDFEALGQKSAATLMKLFDMAQRLSGVSPQDVEALEKNLESDQSEGSGSD